MISALVFLVLLLAAPALAQVQQPGFTCQNHGTTLNFAPILNCGTGTTCTWSAPGICTVTATAGPSTVTGSGTAPQVAVWNSASSITGFSGFTFTTPNLFVPAVGGIATNATKSIIGFNQTKYAEIVTDGASLNNAGLMAATPSALTVHMAADTLWSALFWKDSSTNGIADAVALYTDPNFFSIAFGNGAGAALTRLEVTHRSLMVGTGTVSGTNSMLFNIGTPFYGLGSNNTFAVVKAADNLQSDNLLFLHKDTESTILNLNSTDHTTGGIVTACQSDSSIACGSGTTRGVVSFDAQDTTGITSLTLISPSQSGGGVIRIPAWGTASTQSTPLQFFAPGGAANIRFRAADNPGTNYDLSFTWPNAFPSISGQALVSTTAGVLSFASPAGLSIPCGRLTLTTGTPVTTADVTGATTVFYSPYQGCNTISLYTGTVWVAVTFSEVSHALGTVTSGKPYDVFGFLSSGALALEKLIWTNDTTRATAVVLTDGRWTKSGDQTRLLLGSFYTTSTTATEDSGGGANQVGGKRYLSNAYNRVPRYNKVVDTADNWSYTSTSWRVADGATSPSNCIEYFSTLPEQGVDAHLSANWYGDHSTATTGVGIGLDGNTPAAVQPAFYNTATANNFIFSGSAVYRGWPGVGRHVVCWYERGAANTGGASIFLGDNGGDGTSSGLFTTVLN